MCPITYVLEQEKQQVLIRPFMWLHALISLITLIYQIWATHLYGMNTLRID